MAKAKRNREGEIRDALDALSVIKEAGVFISEKLGDDEPTVWSGAYMSSRKFSQHVALEAENAKRAVEQLLGAELSRPEPGLFDRLLKAKCGGE